MANTKKHKSYDEELQFYLNAENKGSVGGVRFSVDASDSDYSNIELEDIRKGSKYYINSRIVSSLADFSFNLVGIEPIPPIDSDISEEELNEVQQNINIVDKIIKSGLHIKYGWIDYITYGSAIFNYTY